MASTPTTKSQVQAYRFVLRRMQSALVRRDAVMLHDPMRNHSRATAVGVVLGVVGLLGFLVFGFFRPQPQLDKETQIAISKETGQVYVVSSNPSQLIPMTNLASARLLWYQRSNPDKGGTGTADGGSAPGGSTDGSAPPAAGGTPKMVSEAALAKLPKGRLTGIPDAPDVLPTGDSRIGAQWSVCDALDLDRARREADTKNEVRTTVLAGVSGGNQRLDGNNALLVQSPAARKAYLIYKAPQDSKITSSSTVRAEVDLSKEPVKAALKLTGKTPRTISNGLLNAIPEVSPLEAPTITGQGQPASYLSGTNVNVGEIVQVDATGSTAFYVALQDGLQEVPKAVGDLIQFTNARNKGITKLTPPQIANFLNPSKKLSIGDYPRDVPQVLDANENNVVVCLGWRAENFTAANKSEHTEVTIGARLPVPADSVPVEINQVGAIGDVVNAFIMPAGKAGVVRGSTSVSDFGRGPMHLVTGRGVKYGIPDAGTAGALGLGKVEDFTPAPESILRLLPSGPQLNRNDATRSYDWIPTPRDAGQLPDQKAAKQGG